MKYDRNLTYLLSAQSKRIDLAICGKTMPTGWQASVTKRMDQMGNDLTVSIMFPCTRHRRQLEILDSWQDRFSGSFGFERNHLMIGINQPKRAALARQSLDRLLDLIANHPAFTRLSFLAQGHSAKIVFDALRGRSFPKPCRVVLVDPCASHTDALLMLNSARAKNRQIYNLTGHKTAWAELRANWKTARRGPADGYLSAGLPYPYPSWVDIKLGDSARHQHQKIGFAISTKDLLIRRIIQFSPNTDPDQLRRFDSIAEATCKPISERLALPMQISHFEHFSIQRRDQCAA